MKREKNTIEEQLFAMKVGDKIVIGMWDVWRMPTGWVMVVDFTDNATSVFVPDVLNVQAQIYNK